MAALFSIAGPWAKPERNTPSGLIRLSASESSFMLLIRHVMPRFLKDNPQIHIECVADTRLVDIVADGFNAGVRLFGDVPHNMLAGTDTPSDGLANRSRADDYCYLGHLLLLKRGRAPL